MLRDLNGTGLRAATQRSVRSRYDRPARVLCPLWANSGPTRRRQELVADASTTKAGAWEQHGSQRRWRGAWLESQQQRPEQH